MPRSRFTVLSAAAALLLYSGGQAATERPGLEMVKTRVDGLFAEWDRSGSPGCVLGVFEGNEVLYERGYGMANIEFATANSRSTLYDVGSVSKQFTAASVALLAADGKLSLDDDVRKWIPELPPYDTPIRLTHLVHHTSGLRDYLTLLSLAGTRFAYGERAEVIRLLARQNALNFAPGDFFLYSNSNYLLLSEVVLRASGMSLARFARERIFAPIGMRDTRFQHAPFQLDPSKARGYSRRSPGTYEAFLSDQTLDGDGGVVTSVRDLLSWHRVLTDPTSLIGKLRPHLLDVGVLNNGAPHDYASGLYVDSHRGMRRAHHSGAWGGFRSAFAYYPDLRLSIACLCNLSSIDVSALVQRVADTLLDKMVDQAGAALAARFGGKAHEQILLQPEQLVSLTGLYRSSTSGAVLRLEADGPSLFLQLPGQRKRALLPVNASVFALQGSVVLVEIKNVSGQPQLVLRHGDDRDVMLAQPAWSPRQADLAHLRGSYYSAELEATYRVDVDQGALVLIGPSGNLRRLTPLGLGVFAATDLQLVFEQAPSFPRGRFYAYAERAQGLVFERR